MSEVLFHAFSVAHGLAASVVFAAFFYVAGSLLIPRRWDESLGAAVYVVLCWFGVPLEVPGKHVAVGFAALVAASTLIRYRWIGGALLARGARDRRGLRWWLAFAVLYLLAYVYTRPPVGGEYLPLAWNGNIDLLTYIRYTRHLWELGPSNLVGFDYLNFVYLQTPGLFYLLGWFSMLFGNEPLNAAMPAQFALTALIGVFIARISCSVFGLTRVAGVAIAAVAISAPFFRYVAGAYFLSTLMSTPVLLYLFWTTVSCRPVRRIDLPLALRFGSAYVLLLFIYPFLLFAGIGAQIAAMGLMMLAEWQARPGGWQMVLRRTAQSATAAALAFGAIAACFLERLQWSFEMVTGLSQVGVAGWPLEIISPLAMFGFPGAEGEAIQVRTPELRIWAIAAFSALAIVLPYVYFWMFRRKTTAAEKTLVALISGGMLLYCAYYLRVGPSYQQWKFATYTILPLSFVVFAAVVRLMRDAPNRRVAFTALSVIAVWLIGGNLAVHARHQSPVIRLPGGLGNFRQVDELPFFREMSLQAHGPYHLFATYLGLYFLKSKRVHVISDVFRPSEDLSFETISRVRPLLASGYGCEGIGHDDTLAIPELGCLVLSPPSPMLNAEYPFNRSFLFIDFDYMTLREPGGRWNTRPTLTLQLSADPQRAGIAQDVYVNLFMSPSLERGAKSLPLRFSWGRDREGEALVREQEWISLPVGTADWTGNRAWTLPISFEFPKPHHAVLFHALAVTDTPRGRVVTAVDGSVRRESQRSRR